MVNEKQDDKCESQIRANDKKFVRRSVSENSVPSPHSFGESAKGWSQLDWQRSLSNPKESSQKSNKPSFMKNRFTTNGRKEWIIDLKDIALSRRLGSGGSSEVWQGNWQGLEVAVKILYKQGGHVFGADNNIVIPKQVAKVEKAFRSEVMMLSSLRHPNIVLFMGACRSHIQVMNTDNVELQYGIVTEYLDGGSLQEHLQKEDWVESAKPKLLHRIAKEITLGMIYLHNMGIIHRDLKSRNILTDNNWHIKIADFDLSRIRQATLYKNDPSSTLVGTPSWMAPELIQGLKYDEKVDVYSFGMVLFELMTGEVPFASLYRPSEMNHVRIVYDVVKHGTRPLLPDYLSDPIKMLISKCWDQDSRERPSFSEVLTLLNNPDAVTMYFQNSRNAHLLNGHVQNGSGQYDLVHSMRSDKDDIYSANSSLPSSRSTTSRSEESPYDPKFRAPGRKNSGAKKFLHWIKKRLKEL